MSELLQAVIKSDNAVDAKAMFVRKTNANPDYFTYAIETGKKGFLSSKQDYDVFQVSNLLSYNFQIEHECESALQDATLAKNVFTIVSVMTDLLSKIAPQIDCAFKITKINPEKQNVDIEIVGEYAQKIIEPYNKVLSDISFLVNLIIFRNFEMRGWHVVVDANGYAEKANDRVRAIARKACEFVNATGKKKILNPLSPSERYLVHTFVEEQGLKSQSIGSGHKKKVEISKK